ncbi:MAG: tubulin-like doman-containing protein, partial [Actinomycetota bacterium]|nr:tubulin-like doman-containing protein [Actinomycetota bacterium]
MLTRFLLIGVGGSGGTTLRYCWRELERKLKAAGWQEGMPASWQFLHIDVAEQPDGIEGDVPVDVGMKFLGLARHQKSYRDFDRDLVTFDSTVLPALAGWRPDPGLNYSPPSNGAGQRRVVGRVVTVVEIDRIGEAIDRSVGAMMTAEADEQLRRLNAAMGNKDTGEIDGTAAVISSLAGGSGSGAFLDVMALLKSLATTQQKQWLSSNLVTVLYSAEVFGRLPANQRQGTEPNSLAALSEFLNAAEHEDSWPDMESKLLAKGGGTGSIEGSRVAQANFIIGSKNGNVSFPTTFDVYRSVGKAFSAFITSSSVQEKFNAVVNTNVGPEKINPSFGICDLAPDYLPCSSFGYANVSLGRSLFSTYASERLAKRSLERLLRGHREGLAGENLKRDETLIAERVERFKDEFFEAAGLREETVEHNEVLDALRDPEQDAEMKKFSGEIADRFRSDTTSRPPLEAMQVFTRFFDGKAERLLEQQRGVRNARAIEWVDSIQAQLESATAAAVGAHGLPVAIKLLEALEQQLKRAARELERDAAAFDADQGKLIGAADGLFRSLVDKVKAVSSQHKYFPEANKRRREALAKRIDEELYGFAAGLIDSLVAELLPPMVQALQAAQTTLAKAEEAAEKQIQQWSSDALPNHLRAAPNEVLLEPQESHPEEYLKQMSRAFELAPEGAESAAIREVISGAWVENEGEAVAQKLVSRASEWVPRLGTARGPSAASSRPKFKVYITPESLEHEAENWVKSRNGLFADYVNCSLASWLSEEQPDHAERAGRFARALHQALAMSEPLVSINNQVYLEVHSQDPPRPQRVIGQIPLPPGHRARPAVEEALRAAGIDESEFSRFFDASATGEEVPISSFAGVRMHPVVFDSVTAPIQRDWQYRT